MDNLHAASPGIPRAWEEPYTSADTCKGVDGVGANIREAINATPDATKIVLIAHSLGGFAAAKWASSAPSLARIAKIITLDSPLDMGPTPDAALDWWWQCSRRVGNVEPEGRDIFPLCGLGIGVADNENCETFEQLTNSSTQTSIRELATRFPVAAFDCTGGNCLGTVKDLIKAGLAALCLTPIVPDLLKPACEAYALLGVQIHTDLPGTWRHWTLKGAKEGHGFFKEAETKSRVAATVKTELVEVGQADCQGWGVDSHDDWIEGKSCKAQDSDTYDLPDQADVLGIWIVYSGDLGGEVRVNGGNWIPLAPEDQCVPYQYHQQGFLGKKLCTWLVPVNSGYATGIQVRTHRSCSFIVLCKTFFLDGMEVWKKVRPADTDLPGDGSSGGSTTPVLIEREGDTLWINVGPRASRRNVAVGEINESVHVALAGDQYVATGFGVSNAVPASGITRIEGDAGDGLDQIVLQDVTVPANLQGGPGDDALFSGGGSDTLDGGADNDVVIGSGGDDTVDGGAGDDMVNGDAGSDSVSGGDGDDQVLGEGGDDTLSGGPGNDEIHGGAGADQMSGDGGSDTMFGDADDDTMSGGEDGDTMSGGSGADTMHGDGGSDVMNGDEGADNMHGDVGDDEMHGGVDADRMEGNDGNDTMSGDDGEDDMYGGTGDDVMNGNEGADNMLGDGDADTMHGNEDADHMEGNGGGDTMHGDGGADDMYGNTGNDEMHGNEDPDYMEGNQDADTMTGDGGEDRMLGGSSVAGTPDGGDNMSGGGDADIMLGDNGTIAGNVVTLLNLNPIGGDDLMTGGPANDLMYGGPGNDEMHGNDGEDYMEGNNDADTMTGDADSDRMIGGTSLPGIPDSNDTMFGNGDPDLMVGDNAAISPAGAIELFDVPFLQSALPPSTVSGDDYMDGHEGGDIMYGQSGNDTMAGSGGDDYMEGNAGADSMQGGTGEDDMIGGSGRDSGGGGGATRELRNVLDDNDGGIGDAMSGADGVDYLLGDNGKLLRPGGTHAFDGSAKRSVELYEVETLGSAADGAASGDDTLAGDAGNDVMFGQGGNDGLHGGVGDDYAEGNHGGDLVDGDAGQDDLTGGGSSNTGLITTAGGDFDPDRQADGLLDSDDAMHGETDASDGAADGDGADVMLGDNGVIVRPLDGEGLWALNSFNANVRRQIRLADIETLVSGALDPALSGADAMWGNDNDDIMYGQGDEDAMHGGAGDDYMEGNAASDAMFGGVGEDDMLGGTGPAENGSHFGFAGGSDRASAVPGRIDTSTNTRTVPVGTGATGNLVPTASVPLGDEMHGGEGADTMLGDNGVIGRALDGGIWVTLEYLTLGDTDGEYAPRHQTGAPSSRIERDVEVLELVPGLTSSSDLMLGGTGDDEMYGQFDDTGAAPSAIGDEMYGDQGEDAIAGDLGLFGDRVLTGATTHIEPNQPFVDDDVMVEGSLYREFHMLEIETGGDDRIKGGDGGDWTHGGAGNDVMNGDNGNDRMFGDNDDDAVWGGRNHDHIWGGRGYDMLDVHPATDETDESPASCNPLDPPSPAAWYAFGFDAGSTCDGNLEQVDFIYGGWDADQMQANVGENGNAIGDRLFDWVGNYNLFIVCPSSYGERIITRSHSPSIAEFLHRLAEGDGAFMPGPDVYDPSGFNEIGFVHRGDMRYNNNPVYPGTPAHKNCTADSTVASPPPEPVEELAQGFTSTLSSVTLTDGYIHVEGSIDGEPNTDILVDFVLPSGCEEGIVESQVTLGSTALQTDVAGNAGIDEQWALETAPFVALAATFTDLDDPQASTWSCVAFDRDQDSVPDIGDNCPRWANPSQAFPAWQVAADDPDCDGASSQAEERLGTQADRHCAATQAANDESDPDSWPFDVNDDQRANLADLTRFGPAYNSVDGGERFDVRFDFNGDDRVGLADIVQFGPFYNTTCAS